MRRKFNTSLKKGDTVVVITGKDKDKQGKILSINTKNGKVLVEGVNIVKRHTKQDKDTSGGIIEKEAPIDQSNIMIVDPGSSKGTRIRMKILEDGRKIRQACRSGEDLDS